MPPAGPDRAGLLDAVWSALTPELRVAAAAFTSGGLADATPRHAEPRRS